jgi:HlyD family secretion protein
MTTEPLRVPGHPWQSLLARLRARLGWIALFGAVLASATYLGMPYVLGPVVIVDLVKRQDIIQTVVASGQIQTPFRITIGSQITGLVADVPVAEGQAVRAGDVLVRLDGREAREAVRLAQGAVEQSRARLEQLKGVAAPAADESKQQALAALVLAQRTYDRAAKLQRQGFTTQATLDDARRALDVTQSQVRAAGLQAATSRPGGMDYLVAETQLAQAEASLHAAETKLGYTDIKAPRDGTLISRDVERGKIVQPGGALLVLAPAGETQIVVQIDEANLGLLTLDQTALVSADAYPKQTFGARLTYINPSIDAQRGSVQVKLTVATPPDYLRQDMTVSVEVEVARRAQAIVVETGSVHDLTGAKPWVMVAENGRARRRQITVGTIGDSAVEVLAGIVPGDAVVRGVNGALADGQSIRTSGNG